MTDNTMDEVDDKPPNSPIIFRDEPCFSDEINKFDIVRHETANNIELQNKFADKPFLDIFYSYDDNGMNKNENLQKEGRDTTLI